jgi:hypothetical protein
MSATKNNVHFGVAALFLIAASIALASVLIGMLVLLLEGRFVPLLVCIGSLTVSWVLATRVMGLLHSRRIAQSLQRYGRRDLDHSYLHGTRMKVGEGQ